MDFNAQLAAAKARVAEMDTIDGRAPSKRDLPGIAMDALEVGLRTGDLSAAFDALVYLQRLNTKEE